MSEGDIEERLERVKVYLQSTPHSKSNLVDVSASSSTFECTLPQEYIRTIYMPLPHPTTLHQAMKMKLWHYKSSAHWNNWQRRFWTNNLYVLCTRHSIPHLNSSPASFICCQHSMDSPEKIQTNIWRSFMLFAQVWNPLESQRNESSYQPSHSL